MNKIAATAMAALSTAATALAQMPMTLWYDRPATCFEESLPLGNGRLGALVYGHPDDDALVLNDLTLWSGKPVDQHEDAEAHQWIPQIRKALFDEDYATADKLQQHVQGHNSAYYQPLVTLHITTDNTGQPFSNNGRLTTISLKGGETLTINF